MKNFIQPFDFYLLRLPILAVSDVLHLHKQQNMEGLAKALQNLYQNPTVQEAIYLASPELHHEMLKWLTTGGVQDQRLLLTLYKYLLRMSSRCTPYGLFAGFATGTIVPSPSQLVLEAAENRMCRYARLDMNYVAELSKQMVADAALRSKLLFFTNNSLYRINDTYRYYEYKIKNKRRHYYLVAIKASTLVTQVVEAAKEGVVYEGLLALLETKDIKRDRAITFLDNLIEFQILLSELEPTVTGPDFFLQLVERISAANPAYEFLLSLRQIQGLLTGEIKTTNFYQEIHQHLTQSFPTAVSKDLIQTDLRLSMQHNTLQAGVVQHLAQELTAISALYEAAVPANLRAFTQKFYERYEEQEISLLEALDSETGLGYGTASGAKANPTPLVHNVRVPSRPAAPQIAWTAYRQLVFRKFQESQQLRTSVVAIEDDEIVDVTGAKQVALPATLVAMGHLIAASTEALDEGDFKFCLLACNGPGAMPHLARFAHADTELAAKLETCAQWEQQAAGEALLAEIVHLPEARVGNIMQRPQLRTYEIPFLGNSSVPSEQQLPASDLLVSVRNGRVILRSKRLNREVIPRLTTAHNYERGLSVYKFLCELAHQQTFAIVWDWGVLHEQPYLPRVEYKHLILSRAQWRFPTSAYAEVAAIQTVDKLACFRSKYRLPEQVMLVDGADNELLLDFASPLAVPLLAQTLKKEAAVLREFPYLSTSQLLFDTEQKSYLNEVIIPFKNPAARPHPALAAPVLEAQTPGIQRSFALGSEWTYVKIYCGAKWADKILTDYLLPLLEVLEADRHITQWFFIRYADPKNHLRLRLLHTADPDIVALIVSRIHHALAALQQERIIQTIQYETYNRELERYGAATMCFSETVFYHDSRAVVGFLSLLEGEAGERYRWMFAIRGVDELLDAFGLSLPEKTALAQQTQQDFFREFNGNAALTRQLNDKYREVSRSLVSFLRRESDTSDLTEAVALFTRRSVAIREAYAELQVRINVAVPVLDLVIARQELLPSYLHMFLNRIFPANQRLHELVVYHYLTKYYGTLAARAKQKEAVTSY